MKPKVTPQQHLLERLKSVWEQRRYPGPPDYVNIESYGEYSDEYRASN